MTAGGTGPGPAAAGLAALRAELDGIDARLLEMLRLRLECCVRIAGHKRDHGVPMMQPHRIDIVQQRAAGYAAEHGMDAEFLRRVYERIIAETCRVEDLVMAGSEPDSGSRAERR